MTSPPADAAAGFLDHEALAGRILGHVDQHTTHMSEDTWREPVAHYRSPDRLCREIEVLRRLPVPFCPTSLLADPGRYVARPAAGIPIVAVRGHDRALRAFRNSCRHRGTQLVADRGCVSSLVCPYHGWVYGLDGALRRVPDEHGFPDLDRSASGLVEVSAVEWGGLLYVNQGGPVEMSGLGALHDVLGSGERVVAVNETVVDANWKILAEGFLEGYHLRATHRNTFLPFGYDNLTVVEHCGRHSRITFPFRRVEKLREQPSAEWHMDGLATLVYHVFPNVMIAQLSHHTTMVVLEPVSTEQTCLVTYSLAGGAGSQHSAANPGRAARDVEFVNAGAAEDRDMACAVQRGLASQANEVLTFGRFEGAIAHLHRQLSELLEPVSLR